MITKVLLPSLVLPLVLSGYMEGVMRHHGDGRFGMDHSRMMGAMRERHDRQGMMTMMEEHMDHSAVMTDAMPMHGNMAGMDHSAMQVDPNQPFDAQFIDSMIVHHRGAVAMATELLEHTERPELLAFAEAIITAQNAEIANMQEWREAWYPDLAATAGMAMAMGDMVVSDDANQPYEQRFLEAMISHHQGALDMAKSALALADHAEIKTVATAIITAQTTEIEQMQSWLQEWFDVSTRAPSPYVGQLESPVRGLSTQEVDDLHAGRGMGFARMAELNSYPGPLHVMALQTELALSDEQSRQIQAIFDEMSAEAKALGAEIVASEAALSTAFAERTITEERLAEMTAAIATLYGQLRNVHLRAHLQVTTLLTAEQIAHYDELRGYTTGGGHEHHPGMRPGN